MITATRLHAGTYLALLAMTSTACTPHAPAPITVTSTPPPTTITSPAPANTPSPHTTSPAPTYPERPGADGSTGNGTTAEYCAHNQDPGCPAGSYIGPNAIPNPNGDGSYVPCAGTICTNPNHGAGPTDTDDPHDAAPPEPAQPTP